MKSCRSVLYGVFSHKPSHLPVNPRFTAQFFNHFLPRASQEALGGKGSMSSVRRARKEPGHTERCEGQGRAQWGQVQAGEGAGESGSKQHNVQRV